MTILPSTFQPKSRPEEMTLAELGQAALEEAAGMLENRGQAAANSLREEMDRLEHDPFQQGYQKGYQQAQLDIRMAMGCKA
jgi:flagellar biosynthesis/type III secretory pathway protein FliH